MSNITTTNIQQLRQAILAASAKSTSSRSPRLTREHVALSVVSQSLREQLLACTDRQQCNQPACPQCASRRGQRYYNQTLKPAIAQIVHRDSLYWLTVNVHRDADLENGNKIFARQLRHLRNIVAEINANVQSYGGDRMQIWGAREVEPQYQPDGSIEWLFHWHLIAYAYGCNDEIHTALKARWTEPRAVHVKRIDASKPKAFTRSLKALAGYGAKARYTITTSTNTGTNRRAWLPTDALNQLAEFKQQHGSKWTHFTVGMPPRNRPPK